MLMIFLRYGYREGTPYIFFICVGGRIVPTAACTAYNLQLLSTHIRYTLGHLASGCQVPRFTPNEPNAMQPTNLRHTAHAHLV